MSAPAVGTTLHSVMTDAEYDRAKAEFLAVYGASSAEAKALRDQALARIFVRSGWTQEKLAAKEGKSHDWISVRLRFGRFLNFSTTVEKDKIIPANLTEGAFRKLWNQTDKNSPKDEYRFREVLRLIEINVPGRKLNLSPKIIEHFADGKWHSLDTIAEKIEAPRDDIERTFALMLSKPRNYKAKCEKKPVGKGFSYRLFKQDRAIASSELLEKLAPIIKALEAEGKASAAAASPANVAILAGKLRKLLNEWAE